MTKHEVELIEREILDNVDEMALSLFKSDYSAGIFAGIVRGVFLKHGVMLNDED